MKPTYLFTALLLLIFSCSPMQNLKESGGGNPSLGVVGKDIKNVFKKNFLQLGKPIINRTLAVSVREVPFSKSKYKTYQNNHLQTGEKLAIDYIDSLPKPTYIDLEISDKINLLSLLNTAENSDVRSYLAQDAHNSIVTAISVTVQPHIKALLLEAEALYLKESKYGLFVLEVAKGRERSEVAFTVREIFDYQLSGFCWRKDNYGNKIIEAIAMGNENCPRGTEQKAYKLDETKSYLKLK